VIFDPSKARVAVALEGDRIDLDEACFWFGTHGNIRVCNIHIPPNDKTVLLSTEFDKLADDGQIYSSAHRILDHINGLLFLDDVQRKPIIPQGVVHRRADNGNWGVTIHLAAVHINVRSRVRVRSGASEQLAPPRATRLLQEAARDDVVAEVLTFLRSAPDYFELYKAFERMKADIEDRLGGGSPSRIGWPGSRRLAHFTQSATVYRHARHKWPRNYDMTKAMSLRDARKFVRELAAVWLQWRYPQS